MNSHPDVALDRAMIQIRRSLSTARVKGETNPEKVRWFDPKTKHGSREIPIARAARFSAEDWKEKVHKAALSWYFAAKSASRVTVPG